MDELWHAAILDTRFYTELQQALGVILHHRPSGASAQEAPQREVHFTAIRALYQAFFLGVPLAPSPFPQSYRPPQSPFPQLPQHIAIFVRPGTGADYPLTISNQTTIDGTKSTVQDVAGIPPGQQRLIFAGRQLEGGRTLEDYGVINGSTLYLVFRLIGC